MELSPELLAANSLLKRGIRYKIPAPLFLRLLGIKKVALTITQLCAGTELRVAAITAEKGLTEEKIKNTDPSQLMLDHYNDVLEIVALSTLNIFAISKIALWFRKKLLRSISVWRLFELYVSVRQYSGTSSFMNITRLIVESRMTKPNLGQMKGS